MIHWNLFGETFPPIGSEVWVTFEVKNQGRYVDKCSYHNMDEETFRQTEFENRIRPVAWKEIIGEKEMSITGRR